MGGRREVSGKRGEVGGEREVYTLVQCLDRARGIHCTRR